MNLIQIKQRFGIIGTSLLLDRALEVSSQVAPTDISVLVTGESGTKRNNLQVIHHLSSRKHGEYIAVNCGAIPEGTIDSELFGHEKGAFTGASGSRKGYFEVANGGTIFLDEVAELPMQTQVRLLRVLETGEFIRVGSSKVIKTNVRVVAATNENMQEAITSGKFREDLFYRLNTVPINLPALRNRKEDIHLLFRKFASDFADKYRMPAIKLNVEAIESLVNYPWPGNVRQLKNLVEQLSVLEKNRNLDNISLNRYLTPVENSPIKINTNSKENFSERELMYKFLFDMKKDLTEVKKLIIKLVSSENTGNLKSDQLEVINRIYEEVSSESYTKTKMLPENTQTPYAEVQIQNENTSHEIVEESLSIEETERAYKKALERHKGKGNMQPKSLEYLKGHYTEK